MPLYIYYIHVVPILDFDRFFFTNVEKAGASPAPPQLFRSCIKGDFCDANLSNTSAGYIILRSIMPLGECIKHF